jgi:quercetin dioxygenase-like cupin family protein
MAQDQVAEGDQAFLLNYPNLDDSGGRVVLTNDYVVLQRLVVPAGEWEGVHSHPGNQIFVHIKGGEWSGRLGSEYEYREIASPDGEIGWMDAIPLSAGHDSGNTGDTPIDLIYVTLKRDAPIAPDADHVPQLYPDVATELLLHNHRMIVQRVILEPDQWTGIHSHPGNQVYIQIRGGSWSQRQGGEQAAPTALMEPGAATWVDAVAISAGHDEGNTGDTTLEFVVVTIK